ncbi:hypothetical protein M758_10G181700 [Ceratodon purpureus]|uniref:Uncharacterized protein n=1 Tax=Ceratodon purpureus TaxID=3225 RepID=A0A8T0GQN0_CERPU|nr:hypothetical protein KC19_10G186200 [Ceratodon purpureus]KAG0604580.1 hypothetical protein M758_10G181700 [Ceratodon purpureus]
MNDQHGPSAGRFVLIVVAPVARRSGMVPGSMLLRPRRVIIAADFISWLVLAIGEAAEITYSEQGDIYMLVS